ncbi:MAG: family 10 glycosylhydrolase [Gemmatimonadaceae bacterium]
MTLASRFTALCILFASLAVAPRASRAQSAFDPGPPPVAREFRAVWVATVDNMDWPSRAGLSTAEQQREMIVILDKLVEVHMNAIILQVRPAADALYDSKIEPWSEYLTGKMGKAPDPYYDPLTFTVAEAHKRGLELHVWINPYRARYSRHRPASATHISRSNPSLVRNYGPYVWMDPGSPAVRERTRRVVLDLVKRYDIDGVHMDDYFYPYPETERVRRKLREIPFPDNSTYAKYRKDGGRLSRDDWRRQNVNLLVKELYDAIHEVKPQVRFGVSPFGIWRPGSPPSVRGLDQYAVLYADAKKWYNEGWVDYMTPQLYWSVDKPQQRYDHLLEWWAQQNTFGRHLWPGNYTSKVGFTNSAKWNTDEILEQIRLTRAQPGATGNVHFSMEVFKKNPDNLNERLVREAYAIPALVPASTWLPATAMTVPSASARIDINSSARVIDLGLGTLSSKLPWLWVVQSRTTAGWMTAIVPGTQRVFVLGAPGSAAPLDVRVRAVDRVGNLSPENRLPAVR